MYEKSFFDASDDEPVAEEEEETSLDVHELEVSVVERSGAERSIQLNSPAWIWRRASQPGQSPF